MWLMRRARARERQKGKITVTSMRRGVSASMSEIEIHLNPLHHLQSGGEEGDDKDAGQALLDTPQPTLDDEVILHLSLRAPSISLNLLEGKISLFYLLARMHTREYSSLSLLIADRHTSLCLTCIHA